MRIMCSQHLKLQFEGIIYAFTGCGLSACYRFDSFAALSGMFEVSARQERFHNKKTLLPQPKLNLSIPVCLRISRVALHMNGENVEHSISGVGTNGGHLEKTMKLGVCLTS